MSGGIKYPRGKMSAECNLKNCPQENMSSEQIAKNKMSFEKTTTFIS